MSLINTDFLFDMYLFFMEFCAPRRAILQYTGDPGDRILCLNSG